MPVLTFLAFQQLASSSARHWSARRTISERAVYCTLSGYEPQFSMPRIAPEGLVTGGSWQGNASCASEPESQES